MLCRLRDIFSKLQELFSDHILNKGDTSRLRDRAEFRSVFQTAALRVWSNMPVTEHQAVLPGSSRQPLTYTHLQANGFLSLQPVQGKSDLYRVVMGLASLDAYLKSKLGECLPLT